MNDYVYKVICDITLKSNRGAHLRGTEEHVFDEEEEALAFIQSRLPAVGCKDYKFTFNVVDGSSCPPIHPVINSIHCEMVDACQYAHDKDYEHLLEEKEGPF